MAFQAEMVISVVDGKTYIVKLNAVGQGSPIATSEPLEALDFGKLPTNVVTRRKFTMINRGKRTEMIVWENEKNIEADPQKKSKKEKEKTEEAEKPVDTRPACIEITPKIAMLTPDQTETFTISATATEQWSVSETLRCMTVNPTNNKQKLIFVSNISAQFNHPLLEIKPRNVLFQWFYSHDAAPKVMDQSVSLKNVSAFPLTFSIKPVAPFSLPQGDNGERCIDADQTTQYSILFNPEFKGDKTTTSVSAKWILSYKDHPQKDQLDISAEVNYPNLGFNTQIVNFGSTINESDKSVEVFAKNPSKMPVEFQWIFEKSDDDVLPEGKTVREIFDIKPINGIIQPGIL